jgi:uncharacterized protein (UPF0261 family)
MAVVIVGMLDEREEALGLIKTQVEQRGQRTLLVDISVGNGAIVPTLQADITCTELLGLAHKSTQGSAEAAGATTSLTSLMGRGLAAKVAALHAAGEVQGIIAITGMTGALITLPAMKILPFGIPKLIISAATSMPVHAEQFGNYFSVSDITVMHAVVDTVGMNDLVRALAINGANGISGMVEGRKTPLPKHKPSIAMTEFGFCDRAAHYIREILEHDYEIVSFHAQGLGDKAAMDLVPQGIFHACVDLVPGAFSEYLLGGNRGIPGPDRLDLALNLPIPYILCPGGFDMISCGPLERKDRNDPLWSSRKLAQRKLHIQDPPRVQARLSSDEMEHVAAATAEKLNRYPQKGRVKVVVPRKGFSSLSVEGGPLYDPASDEKFMPALKARLDPAINVIEVDSEINSREFARAVTDALAQALLAGS